MFITELMQTIDNQVQNYTFNAYHALVNENINSIRLLVVLYFIFLGYRFLIADKPFLHMSLLQQVLLTSFCYFAATQWAVYGLFVYDLATAIPDQISVTLVSVVPNVPDQASGIALLEYLWFSGLDIAATLWGSISISAIHQGLMALGVLTMTILLVGYGLLVISLTKMVMAIGLSLAPLFILLYLFKNTQSLSFGWLRVIVTAMMKQMIIFVMIAMVYAIAYDTTQAMLAQSTLDMVDVATFLLLLFISLGLLLSTSQIASTIGKYYEKYAS
ncbi:MAG: type IV secretion system protein [Legionellales bacterium]|jgi:type IV secretion system protein VirB6